MMNPATSKLEAYKVDANECINFHLVRNAEDIETAAKFKPEMTHQIFGESETIFGYKNLAIDIYCNAYSMETLIDINYDSKLNPKESQGAEPHNVKKLLKEYYDFDLCKGMEDFKKTFNNTDKKALGKERLVYQSQDEKRFSIHYIDSECSDYQNFLEFHKRIQPFLIYFIDGSSFISADDPLWCYYILYEKSINADSKEEWIFVGYMTVYKFYAFPENLRPRISQVIVLPPYQNARHGTRLIECFYNDFASLPKVVDITVEDPSDEFQRLRDFIDCKRCLQTPDCIALVKKQPITFAELKENGAADNSLIPQYGKKNLTKPKQKTIAEEFRIFVQKQLKLNRRQARRAYEILLLFLIPRIDTKRISHFRDSLIQRALIMFKRMRGPFFEGNNFDEAADRQLRLQVEQEVDESLETYKGIIAKLDKAIANKEFVPIET